MITMQFSKYQGLGNDFILLDNRHQAEPIINSKQAIQMCDRHFGIGADGVIFVLPGEGNADYSMRIFNSDGSEPEMCGNGIRCYAKFVTQLEGTKAKQTYQIDTLAGMMSPTIETNGEVTVNMGQPRLLAAEIPTTLASANDKVIQQPLEVARRTWEVTCVSMGNPHCITFVDQVDEIPLEVLGTQFEHHSVFPQRINTEFVEVVHPDYVKMRVWERGAGITLACGTGACGTVVAGVLTQKCDRACTVQLPGGELKIHWSADDNNVYMTGAAKEVFTGQYSI